jgi:hypothetical protein
MVESLSNYTFSPLTPNEKYCNICGYCNSIPSKHIETFWVICAYCNFSFITHSEGFWIKCEFCIVKFITYYEGFWARCGYYIFSFITHNEGFWIMCGYCKKNCVFHLSTIYYSKYNIRWIPYVGILQNEKTFWTQWWLQYPHSLAHTLMKRPRG